ncbi:hypothetical protein ACFFQW_42655 [Umezawaea endophytica]|uniref:Uncharacterized protein n=1 Tax=Umezawaea endophytica TaxID=1654476 RepID=A0A9X2VTI4_9PSEU|nr:hypothetical protein [Umezawaea endophytica]MCS7482575.1 hypothetical protein [Umezawaea endophytica]
MESRPLLVVPGRGGVPVWFERRESEVGVEVIASYGSVVELGRG